MRISVDDVKRSQAPDGENTLVTVGYTLTLGNENAYTDTMTFTDERFRNFTTPDLKRHIVADIALRYRLSNEILGAFTRRVDENGNRILPARNSRDHLRELLYQQEAIAQRMKKNISALHLFSMAESTQLMATIIDTCSEKEYKLIERTGATVHPTAFPDVIEKLKKAKAMEEARRHQTS